MVGCGGPSGGLTTDRGETGQPLEGGRYVDSDAGRIFNLAKEMYGDSLLIASVLSVLYKTT